jgi:hypothetical protein
MKEAFKKNDTWIITEKLHGCNSTFTSDGFFCSRTQVLEKKDSLTKCKFQGLSSTKVQHVYEQTLKLKNSLQEFLPEGKETTVLLYGEFMVEGTATCRLDIYNYQEKEYWPGHFQAFGIGFVVENYKKGDLEKFENHFEQKLIQLEVKEESIKSMDNDPEFYFVCPLNEMLQELLFENLEINTIPILMVANLKFILNSPTLKKDLFLRKCEGFVLHNSDSVLFKWKHPEQQLNEYNIQQMEKLKSTFSDHLSFVDPLIESYTSIKNYVSSYDKEKIEYFLDALFDLYQFRMKKDWQYSVLYDTEYEMFLRRWKIHFQNFFIDYLTQEHDLMLDQKIKFELEEFINKKLSVFVKNFVPRKSLIVENV